MNYRMNGIASCLLAAFAAWLLIGVAPAQAQAPEMKSISADEYEAKVYASWIGQIIGNIYGLPHENQHVDKPGADRFPYGYEIENPDPDDFEHGYGSRLPHVREVDGAFSDDDTDIEYMYLLAMEKHGPEPTYAQLADAWMHHVRSRVWLANRAALGAMHFGFQPPVTGMREYNPHWFQIDPQLVNEIWAVTAPGMVDYAVQKSAWAARITNDDWGIEPTMFYGAMYAAAFFESDARELIEIAIDAMPEGSYFVETVQEMKRLHERHPDDWQAAWYEMARIYYLEDEPDTRTIWNANLNGAASILALLYGNNDFQRTLDLACALGFDADNQAASMAGLMGLALGIEGIPEELLYPVDGWTEPFNDFYKNETRHDMPDASLKDMARRMALQGEAILLKHGGRVVERGDGTYYEINPEAIFTPPLELPRAPIPYLEVGQPADVEIIVSGADAPVGWEVASGKLPAGLSLENGRLTGTPQAPGVQRVGIRARQGDQIAEHVYQLVVRPQNLASDADEVLAAVRQTDTAVRDSMWLTVGASLYADDVDVIRDGTMLGNGSTFYSIDGSSEPRTDFYGYAWSEPRSVGLVGFHTGSMEENGGWFTSLGVEYRDDAGAWQPVKDLVLTPDLIPGNEPYDKPHFVEYLLAFEPVNTTAIRIVGNAGGGDHWFSDRAYFTSITELTVHGELPDRAQLRD